MNSMPHEFVISGVYLPPLLVATLFGFLSALATAHLLNRYRLSQYFIHPPLVMMSLITLYTVFFSTFIIKG